MIHQHECEVCEAKLTCCCPDRRSIDRLTGKRRKFYCLTCEQISRGLAEVELEKERMT